MKPFTIGICGGTGSGKSTFTRKLLQQLHPQQVDVLRHDCYYRDLSHLAETERWVANFDHPDSLETDLLVQHLLALQQGQAVEEPTYIYAQSVRGPQTRRVEPRPVLLVEGILLFADAGLRQCLDLKVFVDAPADLRLARRLLRDPVERNIPMEFIVKQYLETVRPMHEAFVEPSKQYADMILSGVSEQEAEAGLEQLLRRIEEHLGGGIP
jgi:uridine kinase